MGHIEKHLNKTDSDLIHRLLKDWKKYSGCLYIEPKIKDIKKEKLTEGRNEVTLSYPNVIGYGYDRNFNKIESKIMRVVVDVHNDGMEIVTAYPDLENGTFVGTKFTSWSSLNNSLTKDDIPYDFNSKIWELFLYFLNKHYQVRYVQKKKNSQLRIKSNQKTLKLSEKTFILQDLYSSKEIDVNFDVSYIMNVLS